MTKPKICFIGVGKLGQPCAEVIAEKYDVVGYDTSPRDPMNFKMQYDIKEAIKDRDIIFVAVPTPHDKAYGGETPITDLPVKDFDYSIVQSVFEQINPHVNKSQLVVLISTVLPGTVRNHLQPMISNARFIYNPYLIAMGSVKWDMANPEMLIIGTKDGNDTESGDAAMLVELYNNIMDNQPRMVIGTWDEAESIKIFYNTFISAKIGLVNMILDVAEKNGNINVDVVTDALKDSTQRIMGPRYMKAGMGDAGACHPRDNIALRWLSKKLGLGYDLFGALMGSRDWQARNLAKKLVDLSAQYKLKIFIHGKAYKPLVDYVDGSYSLLVGHFVHELGMEVTYLDPLTEESNPASVKGIILMAHSPKTTYAGTGVTVAGEYKFYATIEPGSILVDPWRELPRGSYIGSKIVHYGNTRYNPLNDLHM